MPESNRNAGTYTILLRSAWQTVNIGDIAHTPGILAIFEKHLPEATVILWPGRLDRGVAPLLRRRFPSLRIVRNPTAMSTESLHPDDPTVEEAFREADLFVHGPSAGFGALRDFQRWRDQTGKPYGAYGVTLGSPIGGDVDQPPYFDPKLIDVLESASFIFTRETRSLAAVQELGLGCPHLGFVPDATFALDLENESAADALLTSPGLSADGYLCAIPRLRYSPYWDIYPDRKMDPDDVALRRTVNEQFAEDDHRKLREVIVSWVRKTGLKVLLCPEMTYQVDIIRPLLFDPLPQDVKDSVIPLDRYWLTDEAASVYRRARAVISMECHSPIMANANGRPGVYLRQPTDTWKGQMYADLGLEDWKFDLAKSTGEAITARVLGIHEDYARSRELVEQAAATAARRFTHTMRLIKNILESGR